MATTEYFVRGRGYIKKPEDLENIVLRVDNGTPVYREKRRHRASWVRLAPGRGGAAMAKAKPWAASS
ncbi:MAG: hypothetical protein QM796_20035 [Chthoniobacteraceae bacterium]